MLNEKPTREWLSTTWYSPRCLLRSHFLVCVKNHLFIVGVGPILNKEPGFIFRSDCSDRACLYI